MRTEETTKVIVMSDNYEELETKMNDEPLVPHYNKWFFIPCKGSLLSCSAAYIVTILMQTWSDATLEVLL